MCGIAGIFAYRDPAPPVDHDELLRIREHMHRRGPDGAGLWISNDGRLGLAHRRLAIIDLSETGAQPMASADGRYHVTFNGEIYNYRELRRDLEAKGFVFRTQSDTEVLLHLYADRRERMVDALRGMFAFGLWDNTARTLFLARDPFGIKPLYYADDGRTFRFASQVKALLAGGAIDTAPEPAGSVGFLVWGHVPEPFTLYRAILALPAGGHLRISRDQNEITRYFDIGDEFRSAETAQRVDVSNSKELLRDAVADSVRHHLVSDVPVGLFLSAGLDSTTLAGIASQQVGTAVRAVTLGFPEFRGTANDEVPIAASIAKDLGIDHEAHWVTRDDFALQLGEILEVMDQPSTDGVNTYFVSRAAAQAGMKVAFSGLGGDELFGGYPSFWQIPRINRWLGFVRAVPYAGRAVRRVFAPLLRVTTSPKYASLLEYGGTYGGAYLLRRALFMPWEVESVLDPTTVEVGLDKLQIVDRLNATIRDLKGAHPRVATLELNWYMRNQLLRDADWAGMAHSLEIRVPLVDVQLFRDLAPLIASDAHPSKVDFASILPRALPEKVLSRAKSGFMTPVRQWILESSGAPKSGRGLRDWAQRVLPPQRKMFRAMVLVTDAFGGAGGIAKFNRDLVTALSEMPECAEVVVTPRLIFGEVGQVPPRVRFVASAAGGKFRFVKCALSEALRGRVDLLIAGHINLAPLGLLLATLKKAPSVLVLHGIDAWTRQERFLVKPSVSRFSFVVGVSNLTLNRFGRWSDVDASKYRLLPNCVDASKFGAGPKSLPLADRLGLRDRTVVMTLGRLASEERYKGFDEIVEALPTLAKEIPSISYLICGDGPDRERLEAKAANLEVRDRVVFTGFVPEDQKADYYRLADAYVMPSQGEGFGIVFLEALACGIPVMGSRVDGSREALMDGALGSLADPTDPSDVVRGVLETLKRGTGKVPEGLNFFSREVFAKRTEAIVKEALRGERELRARDTYSVRTP